VTKTSNAASADPNPESSGAAELHPGKETQAEAATLSATAKENLAVVANFVEQEDAKISGMQLLIERFSNFFGSPTYLVFAVAFIVIWIAANSWGTVAGWDHVDEPPFFGLQGIVSAHALLLTIAVLIRQNRMSKLSQHHSHLDLQINLLTEQKVTRILGLLEADRGDVATQGERDAELSELTKPADPEAILRAIKKQNDDR